MIKTLRRQQKKTIDPPIKIRKIPEWETKEIKKKLLYVLT